MRDVRTTQPDASSPAVERMSALVATTSMRALSDRERTEWFALPEVVEPGPVIDRVDGPWRADVESYDELTPYFVRTMTGRGKADA